MKKIFKGVLFLVLAVLLFFGYRSIHSYIQVRHAYETYTFISQNINSQIKSYIVDGTVAPENAEDVLKEVNQYAEELYSQGDITNYSYQEGDSCVYIEIDGWLGMIYDVPVKDMLSGGKDEISIVTVEPNASNFEVWANYVMSGRQGPDEAAELAANAVSKLSFSTNLDDSDVTIERIQNLPSHSIIIWVGHGEYSSRLDDPNFSGPCIIIGEKPNEQFISDHQREIADGAIYVSSSGYAAITPVFFERYMPDNALEGSLVYISTCFSATDSSLAQSILNNGAIAFLGNSKDVHKIYGFQMPYAFFEGFTPSESNGYIMSITEALTYAKAKHGVKDWQTGAQVGVFAPYDITMPEMIPLKGEVFTVSPDFRLSVYGENNALYDNYTLYITQARALSECYLRYGENVELDDVITNCMDYKTVSNAEEVIHLSPGIYELAFVDNADIEKAKIITIQVYNKAELSALTIDTDFGSRFSNTETASTENRSDPQDPVSNNNWMESYIQVIEQVLIGPPIPQPRGLLYDVDEDGFDELLVYHYCDDDPSTWWWNDVCSVYDFRNGTLVPIAENNKITSDGAAGIYSCAGVVTYQGTPMIMTFYSVGETSGAMRTTHNYKFYVSIQSPHQSGADLAKM